MADGFTNPVVGGGGGLVYPSIHSPNFIHQITGWTINRDGSAEFNNLEIRGTFSGNGFILNNAGFFLYNGTPTKGNLILAAADQAGIDNFGNPYSGPGIVLSNFGGGQNIIQVRPDLQALLFYSD